MKKELAILGVCRHYWRIDAPTKNMSWAVGRFCGEVREFTNDWKYSSPSARSQKVKLAPENKVSEERTTKQSTVELR